MNRRGFLSRLAAVPVAAVAAAKAIPAVAPIRFHPDAFVLVSDPIAQKAIAGSMRYDIIYGFRTIRPEFACRVFQA